MGIVDSLFGPSPQQVQQQQNAELVAQAQRYAQLDPFQRATAGLYQTGGQLAGAIAPAFGMVNPAMQQAQAQQQLAAVSDLTTEEGLLRAAALAGAMGDVQTQLKLQMRAQQVKKERLDNELMQKRIDAEVSPIAKLNPKDYTPESWRAYLDSKSTADLVAAKPTSDTQSNSTTDIKEFEYAKKGGYKGTFEQWQSLMANLRKPPVPKGEGKVRPVLTTRVREDNPYVLERYDAANDVVLGNSGLTEEGKNMMKLSVQKPKAKQQVLGATRDIQELVRQATYLRNHKGLARITGLIGAHTWDITDDARNASAKLKALKAKVFQTALQSMRVNSPTGGAVGNVSDREGDKLEALKGSLERAQTFEELQSVLDSIVSSGEQSIKDLDSAFTEQFGHVPEKFNPMKAPAVAVPASANGVVKFSDL